MGKVFKVVIIDDDPNGIRIIMQSVAQMLNQRFGYTISYEVLSKQKEIDKMNDIPADIMMFDCALSGQNINFGVEDESRYGYELIKQYRGKNHRTKIIFYSGSFDFDNEMFTGFTIKELVFMINELNIYKITNRKVKSLTDSICDAIGDLDSVLISMDELLSEYKDDGTFLIDGESVSAKELLTQMKLGTDIGEKFRSQINETILSYFMKFGETK